jgi:hypothetical protein
MRAAARRTRASCSRPWEDVANAVAFITAAELDVNDGAVAKF